jgi:dehydrogenase/reductase SDR family protein 12
MASTLAYLLDDLVEATVIPSFTRVGYLLRRRLFAWEDIGRRSLQDRVIAITGATSGLGVEAAGTLAAMGATVLLLARDRAKAETVAAEIREAIGGDRVRIYDVDMSDLASVRAVASEITEREPNLDVLINNAGGMVAERSLTSGGFERTFATMVLGPFALTNLLVPLLAQSQGGRIVTVTSGGMYTQGLHLDDLQMEHGYRGATAYARAKRAQVILTRLWAIRLRRSQIVAHAMHPGWADTPGIQASLPRFSRLLGPFVRTPAEGADTIVWLAAAQEPRTTSGALWLDRRARAFDRVRATRVSRADAERLWDACVAMTGTDIAVP